MSYYEDLRTRAGRTARSCRLGLCPADHDAHVFATALVRVIEFYETHAPGPVTPDAWLLLAEALGVDDLPESKPVRLDIRPAKYDRVRRY